MSGNRLPFVVRKLHELVQLDRLVVSFATAIPPTIAPRVHLALRAGQVKMVLLVMQERLVLRDYQVLRLQYRPKCRKIVTYVLSDLPDHQGHQEQEEPQATRAVLDRVDHRAMLGQRVPLENLDLKRITVLLVNQVLRDHLDKTALLARKDHWVMVVLQDPQEHLDPQVKQEKLEPVVLLEHWAHQDLREKTAVQEMLVAQGLKEHLVDLGKMLSIVLARHVVAAVRRK